MTSALAPFNFGTQIERIFEDWPILDRITFHPPMDISENEDHYMVEVDVPGMKPEELNVDISDGMLTIQGERKIERKNRHRAERGFGSFSRSVSLPDHVELEKVDASCRDGTLVVTIPKGKEAKPRRIDVKVS